MSRYHQITTTWPPESRRIIVCPSPVATFGSGIFEVVEATRQYVSFRAESGRTSPLQGAGAGRQASLIEGGLKAYVFAHLAARIAVIGAAEGQFWQPAEQLRHSLARLGAAEAVLFPDAGAVENDKGLQHRRYIFEY